MWLLEPVKAHVSSSRIEEARRAEFPVFGYLGTEDLSPASADGLAGRLSADSDYLGLPAVDADGVDLSDKLVRAVVARGVPVWAYPVHRRSQAERLFALGVAGVVTSSYGYVARSAAAQRRDAWSSRRISPGEMTEHPERPDLAPLWTGVDELTLFRGTEQFITLGQLAPLPGAGRTWRASLELRWSGQPGPQDAFVLAFGFSDDRHYSREGAGRDGYEATVSVDGRVSLTRAAVGRTGQVLLSVEDGPPLAPDAWTRVQLDVTPDALRWGRTDVPAAACTAADTSARGHYMHVGRVAASSAQLAMRRLVVS